LTFCLLGQALQQIEDPLVFLTSNGFFDILDLFSKANISFFREAALTATSLKLRYRSSDQALAHYRQLKTGRIFIPTEMPLPVQTRLRLAFVLPERSRRISVEAEVLEATDRKTAADSKKVAGMLLGLVGDETAAIQDLERELGIVSATADVKPPEPPGSARPEEGSPSLPPVEKITPSTATSPAAEPAGKSSASAATLQTSLEPKQATRSSPELSMDWIRSAVAQAEAARETQGPDPAAAVGREKKDLTPAERERIKPAGDFVMDLTKAMLRTGYYSPDHPGSQNAKRGLYEAFRKCLRDSAEIMITSQETREKTDVLITGILDEPVNVRTLVGAGMAELFVPKLREYFSRKGLVSFAIKKSISAEHFDGFVNVMSDPSADHGENAKVGELLTKALVEQGISDISLVFMDDIIVLEKNLPWRVEMAIQRLAKDLKVLPMFRGESDEAIKRMKLQIIQDILRPLKHPEFLKDLIINCYVIAQHVNNIQEEDIEKVIIEAFPMETLLPTSRYIFQELNRLREIGGKDPDNPAIKRRFAGVRRILKWVSRRLVLADVGGSQRFLEELYANGVLAFDELPADVQYLVNTQKMARDVTSHLLAYLERLLKPRSPGDTAALLKCFRRVVPNLVEQGEVPVVLQIVQVVKKGAEKGLVPPDAETGADALQFIFRDRGRELELAYEKAHETQRTSIEALLGMLGGFGIEILCKVLSDSEDRGARKAAMAALVQKGDLAREWVLTTLEDPTQKWYLKRNALMLLRHVAKGDGDLDLARKLLSHPHARVRDEALSTLVALKPSDAERLAIKALDDADEKIRWRAVNALGELSPLTEESMVKLLSRMRAEPPEEKELAARHSRKVTQLIRAVGSMRSFQEPEAAETAVLEAARRAAGHKKGLLQRIRKSAVADDAAVVGAAVTALGAIGAARSEEFLSKLAEGKTPHAEAAAKALETLRARLAQSQAQDSLSG
jgi:HEAT repeat protein/Tfp pilus assembly protein PilZ